jgi:hypothetical protein
MRTFAIKWPISKKLLLMECYWNVLNLNDNLSCKSMQQSCRPLESPSRGWTDGSPMNLNQKWDSLVQAIGLSILKRGENGPWTLQWLSWSLKNYLCNSKDSSLSWSCQGSRTDFQPREIAEMVLQSLSQQPCQTPRTCFQLSPLPQCEKEESASLCSIERWGQGCNFVAALLGEDIQLLVLWKSLVDGFGVGGL